MTLPHRLLTGTVIAGLFGLAIAAIAAPAPEIPASIIAENMALDARFGQAMDNKDVDGVMACFAHTPDVQAVLFGTVLRGPDALRAYFTAFFSAPGALSGKITSIRYTRVGDLVLAVGTAEVTTTLPDGTQFTITEVWSDVRQKIAGKWVYLIDHATLL